VLALEQNHFDISSVEKNIAMKKLISIIPDINLTTKLLAIGAALALSYGIAMAQSEIRPQEKPKDQNRVEPQTNWKTEIDHDAKELINQVMTAYSDLKGLSFSVNGFIGDGKHKQQMNKVRFAYSRFDGLCAIIEPRPRFVHEGQYDYIWNKRSKEFFTISRADDYLVDIDNLDKTQKVKRVQYIQSTVEKIPAESLSFVYTLRGGFGQISTILALLERENAIVYPIVAQGMHTEQQIKRLPDTVIDGELLQGLQIRRKTLYSKFPPVSSTNFDREETYWFSVKDRLLRRYQHLTLSSQGVTLNSRNSLHEIKINPIFSADTFQFLPSPDATRINEAGKVIGKVRRN
jgi:hypothetical protein